MTETKQDVFWMTFEHEDTFALAWVLGVWKV